MKKILHGLWLTLFAGMALAQTTPFNTFVNGLPAAPTLTGTENIPCVVSSTSSKCTPNQLLTFVNSNGTPNLANGTGTVACSSLPALTGPITSSGCATSVTANAIANSALAQAPTLTLKGNNTGSTANEADLTVAQVTSMLGVPPGTDVQTWCPSGCTNSVSGTWTKPAAQNGHNPTVTIVYTIGPGGGGGSGAQEPVGTADSGGGAGGGGDCFITTFLTSSLNATESVTLGAPGTGGAATSAVGAGNTGGQGGFTAFGTTPYVKAYGGGGGAGGQIGANSAGGGGAGWFAPGTNASGSTAGGAGAGGGSGAGASGTFAPNWSGTNTGGGGSGGLSSGAGANANSGQGCGGAGGGAGGGLNTTTASAGGAGVGSPSTIGSPAAGTVGGGNGGAGVTPAIFAVGSSAAGGGGNAAGVGGTGGTGGRGMGGGGGGSGTTQGGAGGQGGGGLVAVLTYFQ